MAEPGFWTLTDDEAAAFRAYLQKGGFVIFDDFAENRGGWDAFESADAAGCMPEARFVDLDGTHPIFHSFFEIDAARLILPQAYDRGRPIFRGVFEDNDPTQAADGDDQLQHRHLGVLGILGDRLRCRCAKRTRRTSSA